MLVWALGCRSGIFTQPSASVTVAGAPEPFVLHGAPTIQSLTAWPQPVTGPVLKVKIELQAPADRLSLKIYTKALVLVGEYSAPGFYRPGWNQAAYVLPNLASGLYFGMMTAAAGSQGSSSKVMRLYIMK